MTTKVKPEEPHVFEEVVILPLTTPQAMNFRGSGVGYVPPGTPMSVAPQCGVCHGSRDDRRHIAAGQNDSERWPI